MRVKENLDRDNAIPWRREKEPAEKQLSEHVARKGEHNPVHRTGLDRGYPQHECAKQQPAQRHNDDEMRPCVRSSALLDGCLRHWLRNYRSVNSLQPCSNCFRHGPRLTVRTRRRASDTRAFAVARAFGSVTAYLPTK